MSDNFGDYFLKFLNDNSFVKVDKEVAMRASEYILDEETQTYYIRKVEAPCTTQEPT